MSNRSTYAKFTAEDSHKLKSIARKKWRAVLRRLLISLSLPFICTLAVMAFMNLIILRGRMRGYNFSDFFIPDSLDDLQFLILLYPVFTIIAIANIATFLWTIPPFYYDLLRGKKKQFEFYARPYTIPESPNYYIQTGIPIKPFLEVGYEQYIHTDYSVPFIMEVTPVTKIYLGIRPKYEIS